MGTRVQLTTITGSFTASMDAAVNANFQHLADEFDKCVYRDGETPNTWSADQDANSKRLLNLPNALNASEPATKGQLDLAVVGSLNNLTLTGGLTIATGNLTVSAGQLTVSGTGINTLSGRLDNALSINLGSASAATNFLGMNRTVTGAILNAGIAAYNFVNDGTNFNLERYTGAGAFNGLIRFTTGGAFSIQDAGSVDNLNIDLVGNTTIRGNVLRTTATQDIGASGSGWRTGYFGTSVLTPLVDSVSGNLSLQAAGVNARWAVIASDGSLQPTTNDNGQDLGAVGGRVRTGYFGTALVCPKLSGGAGLPLKLGQGAAGEDWEISVSGHWRPIASASNLYDIGTTGTNLVRTGYFGTSVVTPLVINSDATSGVSLGSISGKVRIQRIDSTTVSINTEADATGNLRALSVGTGAASNLSFTTSGGIQMQVSHAGASTVNYAIVEGSTTGNAVLYGVSGSDTDIGINVYTKGAGVIKFVTATNSAEQVRIIHTASATRSISLTGSNGGNPTISTSAGSLAITPILALGSDGSAGTATAALYFSNDTDTGIYRSGANTVAISAAGVLGASFSNTAAVLAGTLTKADALLNRTTTAHTNNAAAAAGTLLNSPTAGNPTKWIPIDDNGTTRNIPAW